MIDETGKVTFNEQEQATLDRIVEERLSREKAKYADHEDIRGVIEELQAFGYKGTAKEIREEVKAQREAVAKQAELESLKDEAKQSGSSPELLAEIRAIKNELAELKKPIKEQEQAAEQKKQADIIWNAQVKEFEEIYPDIDFPSLADDEDFMDFWKASAPNQTISKVWERYVKLVGKVKADATAKIKSNVDRSTASGRSKGEPNGGTYNLTPDQRQLVDEWNAENPTYKMSYKQYADKL